MTKSKGIGRGGRRVGAGRKAERLSCEVDVAIQAIDDIAGCSDGGRLGGEPPAIEGAAIPPKPQAVRRIDRVTVEARRHVAKAFDTLVAVMDRGGDSSRVRAAEAILRWAYVSPQMAKIDELPPPPKEEKLNRKEAAIRDAERPNTDTTLGALMAQRAQRPLN